MLFVKNTSCKSSSPSVLSTIPSIMKLSYFCVFNNFRTYLINIPKKKIYLIFKYNSQKNLKIVQIYQNSFRVSFFGLFKFLILFLSSLIAFLNFISSIVIECLLNISIAWLCLFCEQIIAERFISISTSAVRVLSLVQVRLQYLIFEPDRQLILRIIHFVNLI